MTITEVSLPNNSRSRLASAILSTMQFAGQFTDMFIHEGRPIRLKTAKGNKSIKEMGLPGGDLIVEAADFKHFFASYVDGNSIKVKAGSYWESDVIPSLSKQKAVNRSMRMGENYIRYSLFTQNNGELAMVVRITTAPPDLNSVGLTHQIVDRIKTRPRGLLIITGPTASGKTSTALSILEWFNQNRYGHIVTVEDPIEYKLQASGCDITQREVGSDVASFAEGLRDAMRMSPNAILAGEVRDRDTAESAILGGESGALMIVTTHGSSISGTLRKILTFTGEQSAAMREVMAGSLIGVVRQELVPVADRSGYVMVCDSLHMTENVRTMLEQGNWAGLDKLTNHAAMPTPDFVPMTSQLRDLNEKNLISREALQDMSLSPSDLTKLLKSI